MNQWKTFLNYADELHEKNLTHFKKVGSVSKNFGSIFQQFTKRKFFDPEPLPSPDDFTNVKTIFIKLYTSNLYNIWDVEAELNRMYKMFRLIVNKRARNKGVNIAGVRYMCVEICGNSEQLVRPFIGVEIEPGIQSTWLIFEWLRLNRKNVYQIAATCENQKAARMLEKNASTKTTQRDGENILERIAIDWLPLRLEKYYIYADRFKIDDSIEYARTKPEEILLYCRKSYRSCQRFGQAVNWQQRVEAEQQRVEAEYRMEPEKIEQIRHERAIEAKARARLYYMRNHNSEFFNPYIYNNLRRRYLES